MLACHATPPRGQEEADRQMGYRQTQRTSCLPNAMG